LICFSPRESSIDSTNHAMDLATGFTYRTLAGHPEWGEETFGVEKHMTSGASR